MNERIRSAEFISKTERVKIYTADGSYCMEGRLTSDAEGAASFDGGSVVGSNGVQIARVESWSRRGGLSMRVEAGYNLTEVSAVVKELTDAFEYDNSTAKGGEV